VELSIDRHLESGLFLAGTGTGNVLEHLLGVL
jgi:hypothetical protein